MFKILNELKTIVIEKKKLTSIDFEEIVSRWNYEVEFLDYCIHASGSEKDWKTAIANDNQPTTGFTLKILNNISQSMRSKKDFLTLKHFVSRLIYEHDFIQYCINSKDFELKINLSNESTSFLREILNEFTEINNEKEKISSIQLQNLTVKWDYELTFLDDCVNSDGSLKNWEKINSL